MRKESNTGNWIRDRLSQTYALKRLDLGADARLSKKGFAFETEAYEVAGLGHLCIMRMKAMFGLMRMETVILSVTHRDMPLINLDHVNAFGKETQFVELYDTQLTFEPKELQNAFQRIRERDDDLEDHVSAGTHWYDDILYPCAYHKKGKGVSDRLAGSARDCASAYISLIASAPACDPAVKQGKIRSFAERLFANGGPAVDQVTRLFGRDTAERLIVRHMYGT
ncbi:MAG: hypothetical protein IJJ45_10635 [Clostridia bacterium]|nr:hypothetical protein [Clostridia bacterium]